MANIPLSKGSSFSIIPEGVYTFRIESVDYDEDFGKMVVKLVSEDGQSVIENYNLRSNDGSYNDKAISAFSFFAKTAMNDFTMEQVDTDDLPGKFFTATVEHTTAPSKKDPSKTLTFVKLSDRHPATGFPSAKVEQSKASVNLDDLLG